MCHLCVQTDNAHLRKLLEEQLPIEVRENIVATLKENEELRASVAELRDQLHKLHTNSNSIGSGDGSEQLTVNGMPLYLFASDEAPGDINGQGVNDVWFVVDADGNMLEAAAGSTGDDGQDVGYDYDY